MNDIALELESLLNAHSFVQGMRPEHLKVLQECARVVRFAPNQLIFKEGEPANEFYLIEEGKIVLEAHELAGGTAFVQVLGPDEALGWSWLFPPFVWHFRARAIEQTTVIALNGAHLLIRAQQDHEFGYQLMNRVAKIVIHRLQATRRDLLAKQAEVLCPA